VGGPRCKLKRLIADKGYDADWLRILLRSRGIELICPHRHGRKRPPLQDGRALRRYKRRWKIERTIAWLGYYRRLLIRWERNLGMYRAFMHVACLMIAVRWL
jgi:transposase